jgi:hypothetical protein
MKRAFGQLVTEADILAQFALVGNMMIGCRYDRNAVIKFHLLADAIYWTDEIPPDLDSFSGNCLRFVLRFRTSLIVEQPDERCRRYWETALSQFSNWIGFRDERCRPSEALKAKYFRLRSLSEQESGLSIRRD